MADLVSAIGASVRSLGRGNDRRRLNEAARDDLRLIRHLAATGVWIVGCVTASTAGVWATVLAIQAIA